MKIERISENQIRCTLNKSDLEEHQVMLNELAFGSERAKDLFREMMEQASDEVGFVADDTPLMIEALPVSPEQLVLIITKVDQPEDLDSKFSKYMNSLQAIDDLFTESDEDSNDTLTEDADKNSVKKSSADKGIVSPIGHILNEAKRLAEQKISENKNKKTEEPAEIETHQIYRFPSLLQTMDAVNKIASIYTGANTLYKDTEDEFYYLILETETQDEKVIQRVSSILSEFGLFIAYNYAIQAYFEEHFIKMIPENAIAVLASLS